MATCNLVIVLRDILGIINKLITTQQSKIGILGKADICINRIIESFQNMRTDKRFSELCLKIIQFCEINDISLKVSHFDELDSLL